jgi:diaminopimelate decarboxylase
MKWGSTGFSRPAFELFPDSASSEDGELSLGGIAVSPLVEEFGTPLVVYCEWTLLANAEAYSSAAPDALLLYSVKAFPSVAILELLGGAGYGADVSTGGELAFALRAGIPGDRIVLHGNNKSDEELAAAAEADVRYVVIDAEDEVARAAAAGVERVLVRVTPGIEAETHAAITTGHRGSKFGLPPEEALEAIEAARAAGLEVAGLHVHIGSQLLETAAVRTTVAWLAAFATECRTRLDWVPSVVDLGGGLGVQHVLKEEAPPIEAFAGALVERIAEEWERHDLPRPDLVLEPGRSLVGRAGVTLYRVGVVKRASERVTYVAIDGGMSDNPRPQLYGASYSAIVAGRVDDPPTAVFSVCGKHCESGDVLIDGVPLAAPRRGDILAVPATGAYTLAMSSNYNAVPRPAAVLVSDGAVRVIRRRETVEDLLGLEAQATESSVLTPGGAGEAVTEATSE